MDRSERRQGFEVERFRWACIGATGALLVSLSLLVEPDPRGFGTHTQLGLPPCGFLSLTGFPCPGCGLTTAFAYGVRGDWSHAFTANPLGLLLFVISLGAIPLSLVALHRRWSFAALCDRFSLHRGALAIAAVALLLWVGRFAAALSSL